jgi:hypothetical protein
MSISTESSIAQLLVETRAAHGDYEKTVLKGVHDEDWPRWFAMYLLANGSPELLPQGGQFGATQFGAILKQLDVDYRREQPAAEWSVFYAERLTSML